MWGCGEVAKWWSGEVVKRTMYPMPTYAPMCWKNYVSYAHLCTYVSKTLCILCPPMHLCVEKKHRQHRYNLCFYVNLCAYVLKKSIGSIDTPTYVSMPTYAPMCRKNYVYYANLCIYVSKNIP
jgi:hypothetical protein